MAIIPNISIWAISLIDNALGAAGTSAAKVGESALEANSVIYHGLLMLGVAPCLSGCCSGAVTAFIVDRNFIWAAWLSLVSAALSFVGIINAEKVQLNANRGDDLGYLFAAAVMPRLRDAESCHAGRRSPTRSPSMRRRR